MSQLARIKENVDWRNENIQEETYATHLAFDSIEQIIESEETEINDCILDNITAKEKFEIVCRAKNIDIDEIGNEIYKIIENSNFEEKREYIGICTYEDESMEISEEYCLYIDSHMLDGKDDWIKSHMNDYEDLSYEEAELMDWDLYVFGDEFNDEQRNFIQLALKCKVTDIVLRWL